ncbi:MAG TPA: TraB/GumN family protein, partial [Gammaproteobacteria bacterium]|nr:TraB/GumN family protein [Gammaproteobacteria bacterium]
VLKALYFTDGRQLKLLIDKALYAQSVAAMERRGLPESLTNKMKPWGVFTILNMPEQKTGLFLDAILYKSAKTQKKIIVGLETAEEQTAVFDEMPISSQVALLKSTLDHLPNMNQLLDEIIDVYLRRDLHGIVALNEEYETLFDEQLADEFTRRLVIDRNYRMTERMLPLLKKGNSFIAVGALHLAGEEGILNLLTQYDYEVRAVY